MEIDKIQPGDVITIRAVVKQVLAGVGVRVGLFSKTDQYSAWIREDLIVGYVELGAGLDPEPKDGSWVKIGPDAGPLLWYRNDAEGNPCPERRFDRTWWSYLSQSWLDWPEVNEEMQSWRAEGYQWQLVELYQVKAD